MLFVFERSAHETVDNAMQDDAHVSMNTNSSMHTAFLMLDHSPKDGIGGLRPLWLKKNSRKHNTLVLVTAVTAEQLLVQTNPYRSHNQLHPTTVPTMSLPCNCGLGSFSALFP